LDENIVGWNFNLIELSIIESLRWSGITRATLANVAFVSLQEPTQSRILLRSLPIVHEILQTGQELDDSSFDLGPGAVLLDEKDDEVLVERQIVRVHGTIYLGSIFNSMVVNLEQ